MVKAIVGANWGDEGKGKITDVGDVMGYFLNIDEITKAG